MIDHYRTLGVASTADEAVIRAVYVELMKRFHPDRNASPDTLKRAQDITEAYAVLSDPARRAAYDDERAGLQPWERGGALPRRRSSGRAGAIAVAGTGLAAIAGAVALAPMLSAERSRPAGQQSASAAVPAHCAAIADPERVRTALIMRLDEVGALDRAAAGALTASRIDLAAVTSARDLAAPGRIACLATLAITLPPAFSTASGQGTILSELQFSTLRTDSEARIEVAPDGRLVAALSGIRHQPALEPVRNAMLDEDAPTVAELTPAPVAMPVAPRPRAEPVRQSAAPVRRAEAPTPAAPARRGGVDLSGLDRQVMNFYGQSLGHASADKRGKLERSQSGFRARLSGCASDSCRRDAYLARNVEISRIMMGE